MKEKLQFRHYLIMLLLIILIGPNKSFGQELAPIKQRTSFYSPDRKIYRVNGDFKIIGNINLLIDPYDDNTPNNNRDMKYVDIDGVDSTSNSSSATLEYSEENSANPECSNIIYAGLYWTANHHDKYFDKEYGITYNNKTFDIREVKFRHADDNEYSLIRAQTVIYHHIRKNNTCWYQSYAEVTDYVKQYGTGEYFLADIAVEEDGRNLSAGWTLVVIYQNSKMKTRDITIFDGGYQLTPNKIANVDIKGFQTVKNGHVKMKIGVVASEGDNKYGGDYMELLSHDKLKSIKLYHVPEDTNNFFKSYIMTEGNPRNPNVKNNCGLDISVIDIPNENNSIVTNDQREATFKFGTASDYYTFNLLVMAVDAYVPKPEAIVNAATINDNPVTPNQTVVPGDIIEYSIEIRNKGTEGVDSMVVEVPIPYIGEYYSHSGETFNNFTPDEEAKFLLNKSANGSIVWNLGSLPYDPSNSDLLYAKLTYKIKVTDNCMILSNTSCDLSISTPGKIYGVGHTSGTRVLNGSFIDGHESSGVCTAEPIYDLKAFPIDATSFINSNCTSEPLIFTYCNVEGDSIPFNDVSATLPKGFRYFNEYPVTSTTEEFSYETGFPKIQGEQSYFALPYNDLEKCKWEFKINYTAVSSVPNGYDTIYVLGDTAKPLKADVSNPDYYLFWYYSDTATEAHQTIIPDISKLDTTVYYVAEGPSNTCFSKTRIPVTVIVIDTLPPVFTYGCDSIGTDNGDTTVYVSATENTYNQTDTTLDVQAEDNSGIAILSWKIINNDTITGDSSIKDQTFPLGTTTVIWYAADTNGNSDSCIYTITVKDTIPPTFTFGCSDITDTVVPADSGVNTFTKLDDTWNVIATDNDSIKSITWTLTGATTASGNDTLQGTVFNLGKTDITWTITDKSGNDTTCTFTINVVDEEPPTFIVSCDSIGDQDTIADLGANTYTHNDNSWNVTASDNNSDVTYLCILSGSTSDSTGLTTLNGQVFNMGTTTVEWIVTDTTGNADTCTFLVNVTDDQKPELTFGCSDITDTVVPADSGAITFTKTDDTWNVTATDNDSIASITWTLTGATTASGNDTLQGTVFNLGKTDITWTITDKSGNDTTCTFTINVVDEEPPTFIVSCDSIGDQIEFTDIDQSYHTHYGTEWDVQAQDNDGVASITWSLTGATTATGATTLDGITFNIGVTTVEWTVTDNSDNDTTCTFTVTIEDNQAPTFIVSCEIIGDQMADPNNNSDVYTHSGTAWDVTASDNSGTVTLTANLTGQTIANGLTTLDGVVFNQGVTTVEWIISDPAGNTDTCTFTVTVIDTQAPVFTYGCETIDNQNVSIDMGGMTYTHMGTEWDAVATDNSGTVTLTATLTGATVDDGLTTLDNVVFNYGVTTVEWTAVDPTGNDTTCTFTVNVYDDEAPTIINCSHIGDQYVFTQYDLPVYIHNGTEWDPIALDNSGQVFATWNLTGATVANGQTTLHDIEFNLGETKVEWIISDAAGNTDTCTYVVVVADIQPPTFVISCEVIGNKVAFMDAGTTTYTHYGTDWDVTGTDNVGVVSTTWTLTGATSGSGNTTIDGVVFNFGETKVEWVIADISGNTDTCEYVVMVVDNVAPTFVVGCDAIGDQQVSANSAAGYTHTGNAWDVTAVDNTSDVTLTWSLTGATVLTGATTLDGVTFNMGETTVEWTATDEYNNSVSCTYLVTVTDNQAPTFVVSCETIGDQTVEIGADASDYTHSGTAWDVTAEDNTGNVTLTWALSGATTATGATTLDGVTFNIGVTTVEWTATDAYGNVATCTYTVTVNQIIPGSWTVSCDSIGDQIVTVNNGNVYMHSGVNWDVTAHDNTGIIVVTWELTGATTGTGQITMNGVVFNIGVTTVTWTAVDAYGNVITCSYTVTVNDVDTPLVWTVSCEDIGDQVVDANNGDTYVHSGVNWDATATSGAGTVTTSWTLTGATTATGQLTLNGVTFKIGTTTVEWTATDPAGNSITCTYTVTVNEVVTPYITWIVGCDQIGNQVVDANNGDTYIHSGNGWDATATSTAGDLTVSWTLTGATTATGATTLDGVVFNLGITTVEWTATDVAGNTITCSYNVTVNEGVTPEEYVTIVGPDHICYGETVTLEAQVTGIDVASYMWNTGDTESIINVIPYDDYNEYTVIVTDINGIEYQASHVVTLDETPALYISIDELQAVCMGDSITIFSEVDNVEIASYLWSTGDTTANISYVPTELNNIVTLTVTSVDGCTRTEEIFIDAVDCSDVPVIVYPNPADDYVIVQAKAEKITILDEAGNLILWEKGNSNYVTTIDISHLASGFYVIYIYLEDGRFDTHKLIIEHQ